MVPAIVGAPTVAVFPAVVSSLLLLAYPPVAGVPAVVSDPVVAVPPALASLKNLTFWTVRTAGL